MHPEPREMHSRCLARHLIIKISLHINVAVQIIASDHAKSPSHAMIWKIEARVMHIGTSQAKLMPMVHAISSCLIYTCILLSSGHDTPA